jgi:hypothetical protein
MLYIHYICQRLRIKKSFQRLFLQGYNNKK